MTQPSTLDTLGQKNLLLSHCGEGVTIKPLIARGPRPFYALRVSWLDFKLGFRMLGRYPGLTVIGGVAIAFAIWVGGGTFELISQGLRPTLRIAAGALLVTALSGGSELHDLGWELVGSIAAYAVVMTLVCLLACLVPVRRALQVQPTDALRTEV